MDVKHAEWFAQVNIAGISEPTNLHGSITRILGQTITTIGTANPRANSAGVKTITITLSNQPITPESLAVEKKALEVMGMIDESLLTNESPLDNESPADFQSRLQRLGYDPITASILAADAFGLEASDSLSHWHSDPQAIRFRALHASQQAYDAADPHELKALESHCRKHFPTEVSLMRLRS